MHRPGQTDGDFVDTAAAVDVAVAAALPSRASKGHCCLGHVHLMSLVKRSRQSCHTDGDDVGTA